MDSYSEPQEAAATCPTCGAAAEPGATACASCGAEIASSAAPARIFAGADPRPVPEAMPASEGVAAADMESPVATPTQRCQWCGAENPVGATQCATCHALFARPDQDAALLRNLNERLREEQQANETYANRRRGFWRRLVP